MEGGGATDRHEGAAGEVGRVGEGAGELATDGAATDHGEARRHHVEHEHFVAGHHWATGLEAGDDTRHRTSGEQHVRAAQGRGGPVGVLHGDRPIRTQTTGALDDGDLLRLHEGAEALHDAVDHLLLACLGDSEVDGGRRGEDAELAGVGDVPLHRSRLEVRLGRDAPTVQTGAADGVALDHRDSQTGRRGVEGGAVPGRATADDHQVELFLHRCRHSLSTDLRVGHESAVGNGIGTTGWNGPS